MLQYKDYYFRAPDVSTFLSDVETVCKNNGIDAFKKGILAQDQDGSNVRGGFGVSAVPPERWWETEPTLTETDNGWEVDTAGTPGTYALINVRTKDPDLQALAESFAASDPAKDPVDIPAEEKIGSGTHRIDGSQIDSPARTW